MKPIIVTAADYVGNLSVLLHFSDGKQQTVNVGDFIRRHPHPQYNKYLREINFKKFAIRCGNVVWGKHGDLLFPVGALYEGDLELTCEEVNF